MGIKADKLQEICNLAARQVQDIYPSLQAVFIPHTEGTFHEVVTTGDYDIMRHPAARTARSILEKNNNREQSSFLGMAISHQVKWFGLASTDHILAMFNINTDEFKSPRDARRIIYHLIWHAIDLVEIRRRPEYASKFRSGPMIPKRSPMNLARLNLQADVFSSVMCGLQGEENALASLAQDRAHDAIGTVRTRRAEDYPFVIALEAAQYAYSELLKIKPIRQKYMSYAYQIADEVGKTFDDQSIRQWWRFAEPAQDMAWRSFPKEFILGCAVSTSEDPFVRATGHLVSDIAGVVPIMGASLDGAYNAFARAEANQLLHSEIMERTFEEAILRGVKEESGQPLISAANAQNEGLAEGIILGWCASALQAAGRAFDSALSNGMSPTQAARLEFQGTKDSTTWDTLRKIGESIVEQKRKGYAVTLGNVAEICNSNPAFAPVLGSIRVTMKEPTYLKKLEIANDLSMGMGKGLEPMAPQISGPAPATPAPATPAANAAPTAANYAPSAPPAPGMGSSGVSAAMRQRMLQERLRQQEALIHTSQDGDDRVH